jgi:hypothetical protein
VSPFDDECTRFAYVGDSALGGSELAYVAEPGYQRNTEKKIGVLTLQSQAPQRNTEKEIGVLTLHSQCWLCNIMLCCAPLEKDGRRWIPVVGSSLGSLVVFGSLFGVTSR